MNFPPELENILSKSKLLDTKEGRLGDSISKYENEQGEIIYLKCGHGVAATSLESESKVFFWLENKGITIPRILFYMRERDQVFLLISGVEGLPAHKAANLSKEEILKIAAEALYKFHHLDTKGAEDLDTIDKDLEEIGGYVVAGMINVENFKDNNEGKTPQQVLEFLYSQKDSLEKDTLTHGDYCFPNIMINNGKYGFIDLGKCGVGDKYKDFSAMEVSIKRNFGAEWIGTFYKYYNPELMVDEEKIKYYQLIDQFYYHLNV